MDELSGVAVIGCAKEIAAEKSHSIHTATAHFM